MFSFICLYWFSLYKGGTCTLPSRLFLHHNRAAHNPEWILLPSTCKYGRLFKPPLFFSFTICFHIFRDSIYFSNVGTAFLTITLIMKVKRILTLSGQSLTAGQRCTYKSTWRASRLVFIFCRPTSIKNMAISLQREDKAWVDCRWSLIEDSKLTSYTLVVTGYRASTQSTLEWLRKAALLVLLPMGVLYGIGPFFL